jgi:hypothetical protein
MPSWFAFDAVRKLSLQRELMDRPPSKLMQTLGDALREIGRDAAYRGDLGNSRSSKLGTTLLCSLGDLLVALARILDAAQERALDAAVKSLSEGGEGAPGGLNQGGRSKPHTAGRLLKSFKGFVAGDSDSHLIPQDPDAARRHRLVGVLRKTPGVATAGEVDAVLEALEGICGLIVSMSRADQPSQEPERRLDSAVLDFLQELLGEVVIPDEQRLLDVGRAKRDRVETLLIGFKIRAVWVEDAQEDGVVTEYFDTETAMTDNIRTPLTLLPALVRDRNVLRRGKVIVPRGLHGIPGSGPDSEQDRVEKESKEGREAETLPAGEQGLMPPDVTINRPDSEQNLVEKESEERREAETLPSGDRGPTSPDLTIEGPDSEQDPVDRQSKERTEAETLPDGQRGPMSPDLTIDGGAPDAGH